MSNWKPVLELLLAKGYKVIAAPNPLRGVSSDAAYVSSILNTIDGPIILVGHSYGGAVITNAVNSNQGVKALVYVAAFAPDTGESVATLLRRFPGSTVEANMAAPILLADGSRDLYFQPDKFRAQYAADLPETETKLLALTQRPISERVMTEVSDVAAWKAIPSWFIFGTRDNSIPVNLLAFMAERAGSKKTVTILADPKPDPAFDAKCADICAVYKAAAGADNAHRTVSIDEMTGIQALERIAPGLPMVPGKVERREFEYKRHGTQTLIAAFDVTTGA